MSDRIAASREARQALFGLKTTSTLAESRAGKARPLISLIGSPRVPIVQRSGRGPFKAETRVRFPVGTPTLYSAHPPAPRCDGYTHDVLLMLVVLGLAVFGVVRLGRTLEPRQRIVLVLVFAFAVVWLAYKLIDSGILGRTTHGSSL